MRDLKYRITTGKQTLPATIAYAVVALLTVGAFSAQLFAQMALLAVSTFLMVVFNNRNALIRVYSRMVSCSFLVLCVSAVFLLPSLQGAIMQALFILALHLLFLSYQQKNNPRPIFYSFLCIGIVSTLCIQALFFAPLLLLIAFTSLQAPSARNFFAAMLGLITPYWVWFCVGVWIDDGQALLAHLATISSYAPLAEGILEPHLFITSLFVTILGLIGCAHVINYSFEDNIKTRMFYQALMEIFCYAIVVLVLQPQLHNLLLRVLIITASPLMAQYFIFSRSRLADITFVAACLLAILLTFYNTWSYL